MKKLMAFIGNYKIFLGLSIVLAAVTVILQLYIPILFGDAIDEVVAAHQVNFPEMWFYLKRIVFFTLVSALSAWIMNLINNRMTYRIVRDLRSQAIRHIQVLPLSLSGSAQLRRHRKPCYRRYRYLIGRSSAWLYAAVLRNRNHYCDTVFHVLEERMDHPSCDLPDTSQLLRGKIYFRPFVQNVPETEWRREENRPHSSMR